MKISFYVEIILSKVLKATVGFESTLLRLRIVKADKEYSNWI